MKRASVDMKRASVFFLLTSLFGSFNARYVQQPSSINATVGLTVNFTCEATGVNSLHFLANATPVVGNALSIRGFRQSQNTINGTTKSSLRVEAQKINNNTNISCTDSDNIRSTTAVLMIQGLLASVRDLTTTFINGSNVLLSWTAPYTLDNVPITGYYIDNGSRNYTTSDTSFVLSSTDPDPCILTNVSVSAINGVGRGEPAYTSFYYKRVPPKTPTVSVIPGALVNKMNRSLSLNIIINASKLCIGEYPNNITFYVLRTDGTVVYSNSISPDFNEQTMVMTGHSSLILPDLPTVIINVSLSNKGGEFNNVSSFVLGTPGPVTDITLINITCNTVTVTWNSPKCTYILCDIMLYYNLNINDVLLIASNTHYKFKDKNVDHLSWNISVTPVNIFGNGTSTNATFFNYTVPRPALGPAVKNTTTIFNVSHISVQYNIPVSVICNTETPEIANITLLCNETGSVDTHIVSASAGNITVSFLVLKNQTCNLTIVFSNHAGSSEPLILIIDTYIDQDPTSTMNKIPWWKKWEYILPGVICFVIAACVIFKLICH
ncbi:PREDICTED: uncharacterized protein LOC109583148 [Amphimedon queenslandica]|nr:PREDICTED: uncharacterized protein LOC109583148 [Amphimedon queenslandica]|eukprot:XP_019853917.1 PREDICTED: uncharacterized protein LOC109583148 [Amphimedon queenslandica]